MAACQSFNTHRKYSSAPPKPPNDKQKHARIANMRKKRILAELKAQVRGPIPHIYNIPPRPPPPAFCKRSTHAPTSTTSSIPPSLPVFPPAVPYIPLYLPPYQIPGASPPPIAFHSGNANPGYPTSFPPMLTGSRTHPPGYVPGCCSLYPAPTFLTPQPSIFPPFPSPVETPSGTPHTPSASPLAPLAASPSPLSSSSSSSASSASSSLSVTSIPPSASPNINDATRTSQFARGPDSTPGFRDSIRYLRRFGEDAGRVAVEELPSSDTKLSKAGTPHERTRLDAGRREDDRRSRSKKKMVQGKKKTSNDLWIVAQRSPSARSVIEDQSESDDDYCHRSRRKMSRSAGTTPKLIRERGVARRASLPQSLFKLHSHRLVVSPRSSPSSLQRLSMLSLDSCSSSFSLSSTSSIPSRSPGEVSASSSVTKAFAALSLSRTPVGSPRSSPAMGQSRSPFVRSLRTGATASPTPSVPRRLTLPPPPSESASLALFPSSATPHSVSSPSSPSSRHRFSIPYSLASASPLAPISRAHRNNPFSLLPPRRSLRRSSLPFALLTNQSTPRAKAGARSVSALGGGARLAELSRRLNHHRDAGHDDHCLRLALCGHPQRDSLPPRTPSRSAHNSSHNSPRNSCSAHRAAFGGDEDWARRPSSSSVPSRSNSHTPNRRERRRLRREARQSREAVVPSSESSRHASRRRTDQVEYLDDGHGKMRTKMTIPLALTQPRSKSEARSNIGRTQSLRRRRRSSSSSSSNNSASLGHSRERRTGRRSANDAALAEVLEGWGLTICGDADDNDRQLFVSSVTGANDQMVVTGTSTPGTRSRPDIRQAQYKSISKQGHNHRRTSTQPSRTQSRSHPKSHPKRQSKIDGQKSQDTKRSDRRAGVSRQASRKASRQWYPSLQASSHDGDCAQKQTKRITVSRTAKRQASAQPRTKHRQATRQVRTQPNSRQASRQTSRQSSRQASRRTSVSSFGEASRRTSVSSIGSVGSLGSVSSLWGAHSGSSSGGSTSNRYGHRRRISGYANAPRKGSRKQRWRSLRKPGNVPRALADAQQPRVSRGSLLPPTPLWVQEIRTKTAADLSVPDQDWLSTWLED